VPQNIRLIKSIKGTQCNVKVQIYPARKQFFMINTILNK